MKFGLRKTLVIAMSLAAASASPGWCGMKEFDALVEKSMKSKQSGDLKLAEQEILAAEKELPVPRDPEQYAIALMVRGQIYAASDRSTEALSLFTQARDLILKKYGPKDSRLQFVYTSLAQTYFALGKYQEAAAEITRGMNVLDLGEDKKPPSFFNLLGQMMAPIRGKLGGGPLVMPMLLSAEAAIKRMGLADKEDGGLINLYLGDSLNYEGKYTEAESKFRAAIAVFSAIKADENELVARITLAGILQEQSRYNEADQEFAGALALAERAFGSKSHQYAKVLQRQARLFMSNGKVEEARKKLQQALVVLEKDPTNAELSGCLGALGATYLNEQKLSEAEDYMRRSLTVAKNATVMTPEDKLLTYDNLALVLILQNKYVEAEQVCNDALAFAQQQAKESTLVASEYSTLGMVNYSQGKYKEAEEYIQKAIAMRRKLLGNDSILVGRSIANSASVARDQRQFPLADARYAEALKIFNLNRHPSDLNVTILLRNWAQCQSMQARYSDAEKLLLDATALLEKQLGKDHTETITFIEKLGSNSLDAGKYADAERRLLEALALREKKDGPNSAAVANVLTLLVRTYTEMGSADKAKPLQERMDKIKGALPGAPPEALSKNPVIAAAPEADLKKSDVGIANKYAVIIGISNFKDPSINLKYAAKDAQDFATFLTTEGNFPKDNVRVLIDADANRQNIADALGDGWLGRKARRNDVVVIYVSSHGGSDTTNAAGVNFLCSHESNAHNLLMTGIPMEWFSQIIRDQIPAERVVVFLDVCHSGAAAGGKGMSRERNFDVTTVAPGRGQIIICSSLANQLSWESKNYENGVFTRRLIDALRSNGSRTSLSEAFQHMRQKVEDEVLDDRQERQTPVMKRTWNGDDLQLAAPTTAFGTGTAASEPPRTAPLTSTTSTIEPSRSTTMPSTTTAPELFTTPPSTYTSSPQTTSGVTTSAPANSPPPPAAVSTPFQPGQVPRVPVFTGPRSGDDF